MIRVLLLNYEYPPLGGGAGNATMHLMQELAKRNDIDVSLITSAVGKARVQNLSSAARIFFLDIGKTSDSLHYQSFRDLLMYSWKAYRFARKLIKNERIDVVHAFFGVPCGWIAKRLGLPYIVSLRGSDVPGYSKRMRLLENLGMRRLSAGIWQRAAYTVANSKGLADLAAKTVPQQYPIIPNGVDCETFCPPETDDNNRLEGEPLRLISTGRLIPRKGYDLLIQALGQEELVLIGDGPEKQNLMDLAKGKKVVF
ncbi:MAG: glycosyltransferase family 4 protein, partial [Spirochaetaceae bacterium]